MGSFTEWCHRSSGNVTSQGCEGQDTWACVDNRLHDKDLIQSLQISPILGVGCLLLFGLLNSRIILYRIRTVLPQVTVKPPSLPSSGFSVLWRWLYWTIFTSDQHLLASAGLDALVLVKTMGFGVQLFVPLTIVASFVLIPIHQKGGFLGSNSGKYMEMTLSNVQPSSDIFWVHFVCVYAFIFYALALLYFQNKRFTKMRHHYLTVGDDPDVCHSSMLFTCQSYTSQGTAASQEKPLSKQAKVTRIMKLVTGLGDLDVEQTLNSRVGLMARSSIVKQDSGGKLLHELEERKGKLIKRHSVDGSSTRNMGAGTSSTGQTTGNMSSKSMEPSRRGTQSLFCQAAKEIAKASVRVPNLRKWWDKDFDGLPPKKPASGSGFESLPSYKLASRASIRSLRTVIAQDDLLREEVAVNAQQYCVLITNVPDVERLMSRRTAKMKVEKKKGLQLVWNFLYQWIGGGFSLKTFHPSAQKETSMMRMERSTVASNAILGVSFHGDDRLIDDDEEKSLRNNVQARWDEVAKKVYSEEIFHIEEALVEESFKSLFSSDFVKAVPIRNPQPVDKLLFTWEQYTARLERAEEYLLRTGKRKQVFPWTFARLVSVFRGKSRTEEKDEITYCEDRIAQLEEKISATQKKIMRTQYAATIAAQTLLHSEATHKFKAYPAPGPEEMNWSSLCKGWIEKDLRSILVFPFVAFMVLLPIGLAMGAMSKLNDFLCTDYEADWYWPAYCETDGHSGTNRLRSLVTGWLPSIVVAIWQNVVMPITLYYLLQVQSTCISLSQLDREIASVFFYWDVFNIFLGGMMGGTLFTADLLCSFQNSSDILQILGASVPASANFFVNYVTLRAFFLVPCQFLAPHPGMWYWAMKLGGYCGISRTKRAKTGLYRPSSIRYGREYGIFLVIFLISLCYSVVAPVIVPIALIFFIVSWLTWRYQVLYVFVRKYESGGRMWPVFFHRILYCLFLFQFFTSCVLMFKKAVIQAIILFITVPIVLLKFTSHCHNKFRAGMDYIPLEMAFHSPAASVDPVVYTPPGLVKGCPSWHPEYMKAWEGWGVPATSL